VQDGMFSISTIAAPGALQVSFPLPIVLRTPLEEMLANNIKL
jgi:hypothetical protein